MELFARPVEKTQPLRGPDFVASAERDVERGKAVAFGNLERGLAQSFDPRLFHSRHRKETAPRCRSERHRGLQLGIIAAARSFECVGPAVIEYELSGAVGLGVKRHRSHGAPSGPRHQMQWDPARRPRSGTGVLESFQKSVRGERIVGASGRGFRACASIPFGCVDIRNPPQHIDFKHVRTVHCLPFSNPRNPMTDLFPSIAAPQHLHFLRAENPVGWAPRILCNYLILLIICLLEKNSPPALNRI